LDYSFHDKPDISFGLEVGNSEVTGFQAFTHMKADTIQIQSIEESRRFVLFHAKRT
jgi:hypothetical protein